MRAAVRAVTLAFVGLVLTAAALPAAAQTFSFGGGQAGSDLTAQQSGGTIRQIVIEGTQRIEPGTVRSYMVVQEGDPFDPARIDRSLKSLFATGLFADVTLQRNGDTLVVNVVENPIINRIAFEGNDALANDTLNSEVSLRPRVIYTRSKVQDDVKRILSLYRRNGRFAATVEPKVIQLPQNRVDLVFEIDEGEETEIRSVRFVGNKQYDDDRLREVVRTRESVWWRFFSTDDVYDPDRLNLDRELLRRFYLTEGYADFRVVSAIAELTPDGQEFFITFTVEEGERYVFGDVTVEARLKDLKAEDLRPLIEFETGDWYNAEQVEDMVGKLSERVGELGYAFVDVRPRLDRDRENKTIDVVYEINEGPRVFVERIEILGNVRTEDRVIRREFRVVEGDAFNAAKLRRSRQRIQNLDFFENVDIQQVPGSAPDKTVIRAEVEEKSTGQISLGAGYSSTYGVLGDFSIGESNFLGKGQNINLRLLIAARRSEVDFSFTEPYFLGREIRAGFDIFHITQDLEDTSSLNIDRTGFSLRASYLITEQLSQAWRYNFQVSDMDVESDAAPLIQAQEGSDTLSEVVHTLQYDQRDNVIDPTEGYVVRLKTGVAGAGGSTRHLRNELEGSQYFELADRWVLNLSAGAGYIYGLGQDVKFLERFFIGGNDVRGFATAGIGPRDANTSDALGAEWYHKYRAELEYPLGLPPELGITGRVFTDAGASGSVNPNDAATQDEGSIRVGAGVGLSWDSPFGPLGVDFAYPVVKESFDDSEYVRINFGTRF